MVQVQINNCSVKFDGKWIIKDFSHTFEPSGTYAITGKNGSGKSTLLKIIAAYLSPNDGTIKHTIHGTYIEPEGLFRYVSFAAPYIATIEEFSLEEVISFQRNFKPYCRLLSNNDIVKYSGLADSRNKPVKYFSSGMKQRAILMLAILSNTPLLLLDEPCSNLDMQARAWYADLLKEFGQNRTVIIASNHNREEYPDCNNLISL